MNTAWLTLWKVLDSFRDPIWRYVILEEDGFNTNIGVIDFETLFLNHGWFFQRRKTSQPAMGSPWSTGNFCAKTGEFYVGFLTCQGGSSSSGRAGCSLRCEALNRFLLYTGPLNLEVSSVHRPWLKKLGKFGLVDCFCLFYPLVN